MDSFDPRDIGQTPDLPRRRRPIVGIGAGGIVRDAHLPAYRLAGFQEVAVYDRDRARAEALARDFGIPVVCATLAEAIAAAPADAVFDVACPSALAR